MLVCLYLPTFLARTFFAFLTLESCTSVFKAIAVLLPVGRHLACPWRVLDAAGNFKGACHCGTNSISPFWVLNGFTAVGQKLIYHLKPDIILPRLCYCCPIALQECLGLVTTFADIKIKRRGTIFLDESCFVSIAFSKQRSLVSPAAFIWSFNFWNQISMRPVALLKYLMDVRSEIAAPVTRRGRQNYMRTGPILTDQ